MGNKFCLYASIAFISAMLAYREYALRNDSEHNPNFTVKEKKELAKTAIDIIGGICNE